MSEQNKKERHVRSLFETSSQLPAILLLLFSLSFIASPIRADGTSTRARFLMGTICELTLPAEAPEEAFDAAFDEINRIERRISTWRDDSELSHVNRQPLGEPNRISAELLDLLATTIHWSRETNGAFSPLIGPLVDAWRVREKGRIPGPLEIRDARARTDLRLLALDSNTSTLTREGPIEIEEGAFGKGYAIDRAIEILAARGIRSATINFGGQVATTDRDSIEVAIAHPENRDEPAVALDLTRGSISTTSGSERTFVVDGQRFSHLIDPVSGLAIAPLGSVSVIHEQALVADILSTALCIIGPERGPEWADEHHIAAVFITPDSSTRGRWLIRLSDPAKRRGLRVRAINHQFTLEEKPS